MKCLQISLSLISKHLLIEILIIAQIIICMASGLTCMDNFILQNRINRLFIRKTGLNAVYFQPYERLVEMYEDAETAETLNIVNHIVDVLNMTGIQFSVGTLSESYGQVNNQTAILYGYNEVMLEHQEIITYYTDTWITDDNAPTPVMIRGALADMYRIGDRFTMNVGYDCETVDMVVVGLLEDDFALINPAYGGSFPVVNDFYQRTQSSMDERENLNAVVYCDNSKSEWMNQLRSPAMFLFANNDIPQSVIDEAQGKISGGTLFSVPAIYNKAQYLNAMLNRLSISRWIAAMLFTAVSGTCYAILLFITNRKKLAVYRTLGMSKGSACRAILVVCCLCSTLAALILVTVAGVNGMFQSAVLTVPFAIFPFILGGIIVCVAIMLNSLPYNGPFVKTSHVEK